MKYSYAFLITGLAAQQVVATWNFFDKFNTPNYNTNECSEKQRSGFDWSDLTIGQSNFQYGDFDFSQGWSCASSLGKRDQLTKRTFGGRVVKNSCSKEKPASFGSGKKKKSGFSIVDMDVSVEFDVDLELRFTMTDGSLCKQYSSCSAGGTTIKNTQCGGAISVDIFIGSHFKGQQSSCEIGFHNIGFDCNGGTTYTKPTPPEIPATSTYVQSKSTATTLLLVSTPVESSSTTTTYAVVPPPVAQPPSPPTGGAPSPPVVEMPTPPATDCGHGSNCNNPGPPPPMNPPYSTAPPYGNNSIPVHTPPTIDTPTAIPPPPPPPPSPAPPPPQESSAVSAPCGYGQICEGTTRASMPPSSAVVTTSLLSTASPPPSSPSYPAANPPDVLPKCINSWLQISTTCKDNTDKSCYCVNAEFTTNVINCVSSRCSTDEETRASLQFFIGICAEHIPENPKIIENCPSYIPLNPTPATPTGGATGGQTDAVSTTVTATTTVVETLTPSSTPCTTITYGSTFVVVPLVHFTTEPQVAGATPTEPVALLPGTAPPLVPADATAPAGGGAPYPVPSSTGRATGTGASGLGGVRPSSPAAEFTGAASPLTIVPQHAFFGAIFAFFVL
ncbi:hypothetical protein ACN47E_005281 [Coniothyrium glycines]